MKTHSTLALFALMFGFAPSVGAQTTTVLYATDFETFNLGTLTGQQSFLAFDGQNAPATQVINTFPAAGHQSIQIKGANVGLYDQVPYYFAGFYYRPLNYNPVTANKTRIITRVDVAFFEQGTTPSTSVGLELYQSDSSLVSGLYLGVGNTVTGFNDDYGDGTEVYGTAAPGVYHTLTIYADYATKRTEFYVDGDALGSVAFTSGTGTDLADVDLFYAANDAQPTADADFDNYSVESAAAGTTLVTGRLTFDGIANPAGHSVSFRFTPMSGSSFTVNTVLSANGTFTVGGIPAGTYRVLASSVGYLQRGLNLTANGSSLSNLRLSLLGGDVDGNNIVNADDLGLLLNVFNTTIGDGDYFASADLDANGTIDVDDLSILLYNFNVNGDE